GCLRAEPVSHPGADAGAAGLRETRIEKNLRRGVIELVRVYRAENADVVDDARQMGHHFGDFRATPAVPGKLETRPQASRIRPDEGITQPLGYFRRDRFAFKLGQNGLVIE